MKRINVAVIGAGQMGGSLGLALKSKALKGKYYIIGIGRTEKNLKTALKINAIDEMSLSFDSAKNADVVVICTPVDTIVPIYKKLAKIVRPNAIITDAGSVKESIEKQINSTSRFSLSTLPFVGAHPMAGKENNGILSAAADMFKGAKLIVTNKKNTKAVKFVENMWKDAGAVIVKMDAKKHDDLIALTSHLPHVIAFSLNKIYKETQKKNKDIALLTGSSFKGMTRVAVSSADMWAPIFAMNSQKVAKHLDAFIKELNAFKKVLKNQNKVKKEILKTQK